MSEVDLPEEPVVAWSQSHSPWWTFGLMALFRAEIVVERHRDLSVSVNGIRADNRFLGWDEIEGIVEADDPDLATIVLTDGTNVRLDRWHLPSVGADEAKTERLGILRRALTASRRES